MLTTGHTCYVTLCVTQIPDLRRPVQDHSRPVGKTLKVQDVHPTDWLHLGFEKEVY